MCAICVDDSEPDLVHLQGSERLVNQEVKTVGPERLVYVNQREFAATLPEDGSLVFLFARGSDRLLSWSTRESFIKSNLVFDNAFSEVINLLGTEDATTCHIVILRHAGESCLCFRELRSKTSR